MKCLKVSQVDYELYTKIIDIDPKKPLSDYINNCKVVGTLFLSKNCILIVDDNGLYQRHSPIFSVNGEEIAGEFLVFGGSTDNGDLIPYNEQINIDITFLGLLI